MSEAASVFTAPQVQGKVLIVQDDANTSQWMVENLQKFGISCTVARTQEEVDQCFQKASFHAVISDADFETDEFKRLQIIREMFRKGVPSILVSSKVDIKMAKEAINSGASYLIEKPFKPEELLAALRKIWDEPRVYQGAVERFLDLNGLTTKEKEIVRLILKGLSNKEVAQISGNTEKTIKFHLTAIFQKCGVESRTELFNAVFPT